MSLFESASQRLSVLVKFFGGGPIVELQTSEELGTQENADIARGLFESGLEYDNDSLPDGWVYLGSGISRCVYLGPDGIAYKVLTDFFDYVRGMNCNASEYDNYLRLSDKMPPNIRLARCFKWANNVNAMEYIAGGKPDRHSRAIDQSVRDLIRIASNNGCRIEDLHAGNVRVIDNVLIAIDYAF